MKTFEKIWYYFGLIVALYGMGVVAYLAILEKNPTNEDVVDCVFFSLCILIWHINEKSYRSK